MCAPSNVSVVSSPGIYYVCLLAITTITVAGHTGPCASKMGTYKRNAGHSPKNGGNVFTKTDDSDSHLFCGCGGDWHIGDTQRLHMVEGKTDCWIHSVKSSHSPLDPEWEFDDDPLLKIMGSPSRTAAGG